MHLAYDPIARDYGLIMPDMYYEQLLKLGQVYTCLIHEPVLGLLWAPLWVRYERTSMAGRSGVQSGQYGPVG